MRAPNVILVSLLIATFSLQATAQSQTSKAPPVVQGINAADADPKPCTKGGSSAPDAVRDSANKPTAVAAGKKLQRTAPAFASGVRGVPVNPPTVIIPPDPPEPMTLQDTAWEDIFVMIGLYNYYAEQAEKAGNDKEAEGWRTSYQRRARLNDFEGEILQEIAHDCHCALKEQDARMAAEANKFRAQLVPGATVSVSADFYQTFEDRKMILRDHVEQLREGLGDAAFKRVKAVAFSMFHLPTDGNETEPKPVSATSAASEKEKR